MNDLRFGDPCLRLVPYLRYPLSRAQASEVNEDG